MMWSSPPSVQRDELGVVALTYRGSVQGGEKKRPNVVAGGLLHEEDAVGVCLSTV